MRTGGAFRQAWLTETIRLRETHSGSLHDSTESRRARAEGGSFAQRITRRAEFLSRREKLDQTLLHWSLLARWSLVAMVALSVLAGFGTALGALGDGTRAVNLLLALASILGLHALTLVLWLAGLGLKTNGGAWLGRFWLEATRRLARAPDAALAPRALAGLLGRSGALRWSLSAVSHLLWLTALLSVVATLVGLLSARRYSFNWETTLLAPDTFVGIAQALGWLPARLGFVMPPETTIRLSDGLSQLPPGAQALWSSWLIGCVVMYGVIPRLIALVASAIMARRGIKRATTLDTSLPGYANLRSRLMPSSESIAPDASAGPETHAQAQSPLAGSMLTGEPTVVGLELAPDASWPLPGLPKHAQNAGVIDTRAQRHALLDQLHAHPVPRLLVVCDNYQTPDRGTLAYIAELAALAGETHIAFYASAAASHQHESRLQSWRTQLEAAGITPGQLHTTLNTALAWLDGSDS